MCDVCTNSVEIIKTTTTTDSNNCEDELVLQTVSERLIRIENRMIQVKLNGNIQIMRDVGIESKRAMRRGKEKKINERRKKQQQQHTERKIENNYEDAPTDDGPRVQNIEYIEHRWSI